MLVRVIAGLAGLIAFASGAAGAEPERMSQCLAMAAAPGLIQKVSFTPSALSANQVEITYVTHSTYRLKSAGGVTIATDYAGFAGAGKRPDVVTMNHAHTTHYTDFPDPKIPHVLHGWNPKGGPAKHKLVVGEFLIRNVTTDILNFAGIREPDGNSIFIFEVAGLCIGHLGHLHHKLTPGHFANIGRLDVVMVPVDGGYTLAHTSMVDLLKTLRASIILPMHAFGPSTLGRFLKEMGETFKIEVRDSPTLVVSARTLPKTPVVIVLPGL